VAGGVTLHDENGQTARSGRALRLGRLTKVAFAFVCFERSHILCEYNGIKISHSANTV
jgi:hypothetical protein